MRHSLLAVLACLAFSLTAHASDIMFDINSAFSSGGSFSGSFLINSTTELLDGGSINVTLPGSSTPNTFSNVGGNSFVPGFETFTDANGNTFYLALNGSISDLAVNTVPIWGTVDTHFTLASGTRFDAFTSGLTEVSPAVAPEPSSLLLFGTGALGLAGSFRRRLLNT